MKNYLCVLLCVLLLMITTTVFPRTDSGKGKESIANIAHLKDFEVIELRRYTVKAEERKHFAQHFESYFPEAFEQLGAIVFGQFFERKNPSGFTWIRGFKNMDAQATVNSSFYFGPVWKEHRSKMNERMIDTDNVLLLHPFGPDRGVSVLPAVDLVAEPAGAQGVVVAQIFQVHPDKLDAFVEQAQATFEGYRIRGVREAGLLVTLDARNNFPQLPVRTDGPYLVWLGIVEDNQKLEKQLTPLAEKSASSLSGTGFLRNAPEWIILDPTPRSRLRWISQ